MITVSGIPVETKTLRITSNEKLHLTDEAKVFKKKTNGVNVQI